MALPLAEAEQFRRDNQRRQVETIREVRREWSKMSDDLDESWAQIEPRIIALVAAGQLGAVRRASRYVTEALGAQGSLTEGDWSVNPSAFVGMATITDQMMYGSLPALLYGSVVRARSFPAESLTQRLEVGGSHLDNLVNTQVGDAAKQATSTQLAAWEQAGYIRMITPPCCKRCAVLDGKWFRSNEGFDRHLNCDCTHVVSREVTKDYRSVGPEDVKDLTIAERATIEAGADMNQVINASRKGQRSPDGMWTTEGTTRRGWSNNAQRMIARQRGERLVESATQVGRRGAVENYVVRRSSPRPTPAAIFRFATDRDDLTRLLAQNGYIVGNRATLARLAG